MANMVWADVGETDAATLCTNVLRGLQLDPSMSVERLRADLDIAQRARTLAANVVSALENDDGEPCHIAIEPEREPGQYQSPDGYTFNLAPAVSPAIWDDLLLLAGDLQAMYVDWPGRAAVLGEAENESETSSE